MPIAAMLALEPAQLNLNPPPSVPKASPKDPPGPVSIDEALTPVPADHAEVPKARRDRVLLKPQRQELPSQELAKGRVGVDQE